MIQMMHCSLKGDSCTVKDSLLHRMMFLLHWKSKIKSVLVSLHHDQVPWSVAIIISPHRFHHEFHAATLKAHWPKNVLRVLMPALRKLGDSHGHIIVAPQPARGELGGGAVPRYSWNCDYSDITVSFAQGQNICVRITRQQPELTPKKKI